MNNAYNPRIHHRKSIRLKNYDYSRVGLYFITVCTQNQLHLFGEIINDSMVLNDAGEMIQQIWYKIPNDFHNIKLHEFIIMPNHIHSIIEIIPVGADSISAHETNVPTIIQSFKRHTTIEYIKMVKRHILAPFDRRIWQRNYWEHIIRDEHQYCCIAQYIVNNPRKWMLDQLNGGVGNAVMEQSAPYDQKIWMV